MSLDPQPGALPGAPPPKKKAGCMERGCIGCVVGCGVLVLLLAIGGVLFFTWFFAPAPIVAAETLVGPDARTFVLIHADPKQPGTIDLLTRLVIESQKH